MVAGSNIASWELVVITLAREDWLDTNRTRPVFNKNRELVGIEQPNGLIFSIDYTELRKAPKSVHQALFFIFKIAQLSTVQTDVMEQIFKSEKGRELARDISGVYSLLLIAHKKQLEQAIREVRPDLFYS
ncbi:hypothetical protein COY25_02980 [Candidatus Uhrbacteria bacterium CG_4_10_14_0_2_um_filter_41_7]|uniref:Uncharacterized protein n=1 Tax=Candidatus Uhrbacteria bacterium CG_4_9_14_3_um_filter_41_35 TaxID=1975034 RepID=A0A2M7XDP3_9BACT|nr:MAG: hypothetical protein COV92_03060 [Candidatus Uhrbacteria bacterium CG11_big_fil_rev_8_21_14_0_20_41_9]PIZ53796.1 MAG: hypothetical protein COY25_02980 [Candidatus Uhrbacteria bacterium CG_4_10_14_0_2_um_filter_41_7]PJA45993.1 MAG: hypothetical protein CO173_03910 [Candidatus Uhrbacteria bacterium CG_4_9_14_3_um_filter_41_35]